MSLFQCSASQQILDHLLQDMHMDAQLSLPPLLHLSAIMARDLQQEYLPLLPRFINKVWESVGECHTLYV